MLLLPKAARYWPGWRKATAEPRAARAEVWSQTAQLLEASPFWRARMGAKMPPLSAFSLTTYDDYADAMERCYPGEVSELNGEPIRWWVKSSGSTGPSKKFPWTPSYCAQFDMGSTMTLPMITASARIVGKAAPTLNLGAMNTSEVSPAGIPVGYASAFTNSPEGRIYPPEVGDDPDKFKNWMPLYALAVDLHSAFTITCEPIFTILDRIGRQPDLYLAHLRGERTPPDGLPAPAVSPERLAWLEEVLTSDEPPTLHRLWPNWRLVQTWRAGMAGLQAQRLAKVAPKLQFMDTSYNATEGPIANPVEPDAVGGPLHPGALIHEFLEEGAEPIPENVLQPWDLQPGRCYEILLTTAMGLVRYRIFDVVRCTGYFQATPTLRYERRAKGEVSLGVSTFSEHEIIEVLLRVDLDPHIRCVFAPSESGRRLVAYADRPLPDETVERMHRVLLEVNATYGELAEHGWTARLTHALLPPDHPVWAHCAPRHAQAKPKVLLQDPPSAFDA